MNRLHIRHVLMAVRRRELSGLVRSACDLDARSAQRVGPMANERCSRAVRHSPLRAAVERPTGVDGKGRRPTRSASTASPAERAPNRAAAVVAPSCVSNGVVAKEDLADDGLRDAPLLATEARTARRAEMLHEHFRTRPDLPHSCRVDEGHGPTCKPWPPLAEARAATPDRRGTTEADRSRV